MYPIVYLIAESTQKIPGTKFNNLEYKAIQTLKQLQLNSFTFQTATMETKCKIMYKMHGSLGS